MMKIAEKINRILTEALNPIEIQVVDQSHLHEGHAGARPGGETHFEVTIVTDMFTGRSRTERHRMIHRSLADLLNTQVHALSLKAFSPGERTKNIQDV